MLRVELKEVASAVKNMATERKDVDNRRSIQVNVETGRKPVLSDIQPLVD